MKKGTLPLRWVLSPEPFDCRSNALSSEQRRFHKTFLTESIYANLDSGWEVLPNPPYSPDLAPSDYHFFRSMQNALTGIRFTSENGIKNWLDSFLAAKPVQFFWDGIHKSPERWEKVIASDGQYFEEYYCTCFS